MLADSSPPHGVGLRRQFFYRNARMPTQRSCCVTNTNPVNSCMTGLLNSEGHRATMLREDFSKIGIGFAVDSQGNFYYCQRFKLLSKGKGSLRRASPGHKPHKHLQPNHCMSIVYFPKTVKQYNKKTAADFVGCCKKINQSDFYTFSAFLLGNSCHS